MPKRNLFGKLEGYFIFFALFHCTINDSFIWLKPLKEAVRMNYTDLFRATISASSFGNT